MGRQDLINHIEAELDTGSDIESEKGSRPALCQNCGHEIVSEDEKNSQQGDYIVHRIPAHGESRMNTVFYCSVSCFKRDMAEMFSPSPQSEP
jgi:hypothetical protein